MQGLPACSLGFAGRNGTNQIARIDLTFLLLKEALRSKDGSGILWDISTDVRHDLFVRGANKNGAEQRDRWPYMAYGGLPLAYLYCWVQMNVVPRSTGNTNSRTRELTLKCKFKCYFKPMNNPLGVSPSKGKQGTTRGKEPTKNLLTRELTLKCKFKCYFKPMNNPLGVSPRTTRGKEKIFWPRWESNPRPTD